MNTFRQFGLWAALATMIAPTASAQDTSLEAMKETSRRALEMWTGGAAVDTSIFTPDYQNHQEPLADGGAGSIDLATWASVVEANHSAFPDLAVTIIDQVAEGDRVSSHWRFTATQQGAYEGHPATGKPASWTGVSIDQFDAGKIKESWVVWDKYTQFEQLDLLGKSE